jgi:N-terminal domain of NWD NACHT-NTPase
MTDEKSSRSRWLPKFPRSEKSKHKKQNKITDDKNQDTQLVASPHRSEDFSNSNSFSPEDVIAPSDEKSIAPSTTNDLLSVPVTTIPSDDSLTTKTTIKLHTPVRPDQLWDQAYDDLKRSNPKLFDFYETILSRELTDDSIVDKGNVIEQSDWTKRGSQMDQLLKNGLDKTEKVANVEKKIGIAINILLSVKEVVGSSLQPVPVAAIAWSGLCVALNVSEPEKVYLSFHSHQFRYS